jgi:hypothetical protein
VQALIDENAQLRERLAVLTAERDALIAQWPEYFEGLESIHRVIDFTDGTWWVEFGTGHTGGYESREQAVRAAAGLDGPPPEEGGTVAV